MTICLNVIALCDSSSNLKGCRSSRSSNFVIDNNIEDASSKIEFETSDIDNVGRNSTSQLKIGFDSQISTKEHSQNHEIMKEARLSVSTEEEGAKSETEISEPNLSIDLQTISSLFRRLMIFFKVSNNTIDTCIKSNSSLTVLEYLKKEVIGDLLGYICDLEEANHLYTPKKLRKLISFLKENINMFSCIITSEIEIVTTYGIFTPSYVLNSDTQNKNLERDVKRSKNYNTVVASRIRSKNLPTTIVTTVSSREKEITELHVNMLGEQISYLTEKLGKITDDKEMLLFQIKMMEESNKGISDVSSDLKIYLKEKLKEYRSRYIHAIGLINSLKLEIVSLRNRRDTDEIVLPLNYMNFSKETP